MYKNTHPLTRTWYKRNVCSGVILDVSTEMSLTGGISTILQTLTGIFTGTASKCVLTNLI
jgi:hypothetical protein